MPLPQIEHAVSRNWSWLFSPYFTQWNHPLGQTGLFGFDIAEIERPYEPICLKTKTGYHWLKTESFIFWTSDNYKPCKCKWLHSESATWPLASDQKQTICGVSTMRHLREKTAKMHFGVHNDIIAAFQITHGIYRWFGLNKCHIISNGDYLLELRLGPLKGLCCAKREKKETNKEKRLTKWANPKKNVILLFVLSQFTSSSSSSLSSNAIPLADWLWLWELDLLNDDDDGTDLVCGWEKDREQRHKKKKCKNDSSAHFFFSLYSPEIFIHTWEGVAMFSWMVCLRQSHQWLTADGYMWEMGRYSFKQMLCVWRLAHFICCVGHCRANPRWPLGWSLKRWSERNTEEGGGKGMKHEK